MKKLTLIGESEIYKVIKNFFIQTHKFIKVIISSLTDRQISELESWYINNGSHQKGIDEPSKLFVSVGEVIAHLKHDLDENSISESEEIRAAKSSIDYILDNQTPVKG